MKKRIGFAAFLILIVTIVAAIYYNVHLSSKIDQYESAMEQARMNLVRNMNTPIQLLDHVIENPSQENLEQAFIEGKNYESVIRSYIILSDPAKGHVLDCCAMDASIYNLYLTDGDLSDEDIQKLRKVQDLWNEFFEQVPRQSNIKTDGAEVYYPYIKLVEGIRQIFSNQ
ncbi:MAG: hypothetical protein H0Z32_11860 [Bacillaceae bacterium]|nr:hypothetical protein [Bacillaceae bacterium]